MRLRCDLKIRCDTIVSVNMSAYSLITNSSPIDETGVLFSWSHINVDTQPSKGETKQLVKDATGVARPGELVAIMGASGAGKSTLLNALTFRNLNGLQVIFDRIKSIKKSILLNGLQVIVD